MPWDIVPPLAWILRIIGRSRTQARDPRRAAAVDGGASPPALPNGGAVLIAFLAHVCLILAIVRLDVLSVPATGLRAVAVPVVTSGPPLPNLSAASEPTPGNGFAPDKPAQAQREMSWDSAMHGSKRSLELQQLRSRTSSSALGDPVYNFRAFVVPVAAANASDPVSYQILVGDLLERAKQYPASALRRGAKGTAKIGFRIDKSGGLETVSLLRSSGQADLDSEGVALVRRASPFPPPPAGTQRSFAIDVAFGGR
jgi:TonB family protein